MISWGQLRTDVIAQLTAAGVASPEFEARWLTEFVSGADATEWSEVQRAAVPSRLQQRCAVLVARRIDGEPLQYVLGEWTFRDFDVMVDRRVLIPRPETEWVVEIALREAERVGLRRGRRGAFDAAPTGHVADLGTGSGAIAIALERTLPDVTVWACDASADALAVAAANAMGNATQRIRTAHGSWFDALDESLRGELALVVTNPPYISESEYELLAPEVRDHEPVAALVSGPTGLEAIESLLDAAPDWLRPGAALVCEIAPHQHDDVATLAARRGRYGDVEVVADLTGRSRVLVARANG